MGWETEKEGGESLPFWWLAYPQTSTTDPEVLSVMQSPTNADTTHTFLRPFISSPLSSPPLSGNPVAKGPHSSLGPRFLPILLSSVPLPLWRCCGVWLPPHPYFLILLWVSSGSAMLNLGTPMALHGLSPTLFLSVPGMSTQINKSA